MRPLIAFALFLKESIYDPARFGEINHPWIMTDPEQPLRSLHTKFCTLTSRTDRYEPYRYEWAAWSRLYNEQDLVDTISYILLVNKSRKRGMEIQTSVRRLICDLQEFERHRADMDQQARVKAAKKRAWVADEGTTQLAAMRHESVTPPVTEPRLSKDLILSNLDKLRSEIKG